MISLQPPIESAGAVFNVPNELKKNLEAHRHSAAEEACYGENEIFEVKNDIVNKNQNILPHK